jgi:hypothetical protein
MVGNFADQRTYEDGARRLHVDPDVGAFAGIGNDTAMVDGRSAEIVEVQPQRGSIWPTITRGRAPARTGEVALGAKLMEELSKDIGETVVVSGPSGPGETLQVVGETVVDLAPRSPEIEPGKAALLTLDTARLIEPDLGVAGFAVQFAPGVPHDEALDRLDASFPHTLTTPEPPPDLVNLRRIDRLPALLTMLIVVLAVGTLAHTMSLSIRRRHREFAVLKSLGFVRRQVSATVAWQATVSTLIAIVIGIPLGIALGRWIWIFIAGGLGVRSVASFPVWTLVGIALATLLVGNLVAAGPAWLASRIRPSAALRTE